MFYPRQASRDLVTTGRILPVILMLPFIFLAVLAKDEAMLYAVIKSSPEETRAYVTGIEQGQCRYGHCTSIFYEFEAKNGDLVTGVYIAKTVKEHTSIIQSGGFDIVYSDWWPSYSIIKYRLDRNKGSFIMFTVCLAIIAFLTVASLVGTILHVKHKAKDKYY